MLGRFFVCIEGKGALEIGRYGAPHKATAPCAWEADGTDRIKTRIAPGSIFIF
jgi:hypothetical protein